MNLRWVLGLERWLHSEMHGLPLQRAQVRAHQVRSRGPDSLSWPRMALYARIHGRVQANACACKVSVYNITGWHVYL